MPRESEKIVLRFELFKSSSFMHQFVAVHQKKLKEEVRTNFQISFDL